MADPATAPTPSPANASGPSERGQGKGKPRGGGRGGGRGGARGGRGGGSGGGSSKLRGLEKDSPAVRLSKTLSYILRHGAQKEGIPIRPDGYVKVDDLVRAVSSAYRYMVLMQCLSSSPTTASNLKPSR